MSGRISEKSRLLLTTILWGMTFSEKAIRAIHGWHFLWLRFPASDKFPNQPTAPGEWKEEVSPTCSWKNHFHPVSLGLLKLRKQTIWDLRLQLASFVGGVHFGNNLVEKVIHKLNFSETQMLSKVLHHCHCLSWLVHYLQPVLSRVMKQIFVGNHWQSFEMCFCKRSWVIDFIDMIRQLILSNLLDTVEKCPCRFAQISLLQMASVLQYLHLESQRLRKMNWGEKTINKFF